MTNLFWKNYFRKLSASYGVQFEQGYTKKEYFVAMTKDLKVFYGSCKNEDICILKIDDYMTTEAIFYHKVLGLENITDKMWHFAYGKRGNLL